MSYELHLPPLRPDRNPTNGRFLKGHEPANKGKKWGEYMGRRAQKRAMKGWANLDKFRPRSRPDNCDRCRVQVVAVKDDGTWCVLPYIGAAAVRMFADAANTIGRDTSTKRRGTSTPTINIWGCGSTTRVTIYGLQRFSANEEKEVHVLQSLGIHKNTRFTRHT